VLDLTRADSEPVRFAERLQLPLPAGEEVVSLAPVELAGMLTRSERGYLLDGEVRSEAVLRCARCLAEFPFHFSEPVELKLLALAGAPRDDETRLGREDLEVRFFDSPQLDLAELAAEQFELALPAKPLCSPTCRGLCPRCGANLNEAACGCTPEQDGRWTPLLDWRPSR
jgi:uncharacterized protein